MLNYLLMYWFTKRSKWFYRCKPTSEERTTVLTDYGLGSPGIESRWRYDFQHPSTQDLGHTQPHVKLIPSLFPGGKSTGKWR
jgi:hypothetical protein